MKKKKTTRKSTEKLANLDWVENQLRHIRGSYKKPSPKRNKPLIMAPHHPPSRRPHREHKKHFFGITFLLLFLVLFGTFIAFQNGGNSLTGAAIGLPILGIQTDSSADDLVTFFDDFDTQLKNATRWYNDTSGGAQIDTMDSAVAIFAETTGSNKEAFIITNYNLSMHSFNITANVSLPNTTYESDDLLFISLGTFNQSSVNGQTLRCELAIDGANGALGLTGYNDTGFGGDAFNIVPDNFGNNISVIMGMQYDNDTRIVNCSMDAGGTHISGKMTATKLIGQDHGVGIYGGMMQLFGGGPNGYYNGTIFDFNYSLAPAEVPLAIDSITLNSTDPSKNDTNQNLTSYPTISGSSGAVRNITTWNLNGTPQMLLYLPFEPSGDLNGTDYAGFNQNVTTVANGPTYLPAEGYGGSAGWQFTGADSNLQLSTTGFPTIGTDDYTLEAWVQTISSANYRAIFSINSYDPAFYVHGGNLLVYDGGNIASDTGLSIDDGDWHHVAFVRNSSASNNLQFYLDGVRAGVNTHTDSLPASTTLYVGFDGSGGDQFSGTIDELKWWNRSLTQEQIQAIFNNRTNLLVSQETDTGQNWTVDVTPNDNTSDGATVRSNQVVIIPTPFAGNSLPTVDTLVLNSTDLSNDTNQNLTAYVTTSDSDGDNVKVIYNWLQNSTPIAILNMPFESDGSLNTTDFSGYGYAGIPNGATWNSTGGFDGNGSYEFDGSVDNITIPLSGRFDLEDNFSLSTWIYPTNVTGTNIILYRGDSVERYYFYLNNDELVMGSRDDGAFSFAETTSTNFQTNTWYHIFGTTDASLSGDNRIKLYVNGVLQARSVTWNNGFDSTETPFLIGTDTGSNDFDGTIDEVMVWNRSLSPEQVLALFNNQTNLLVSNETTTGQNWTVDATPNDGINNGTKVRSNQIIIIPTAAATPILDVNRTYPFTHSNTTQNRRFNITLNVTCEDASCSDVATSLKFNPIINYNFEDVTLGGWITGGDADWLSSISQPQDAAASAQSGDIADNQNTWINQSITMNSPGILTFYWNVSSESGWDFLNFCPDAPSCARTSGFDSQISGQTAMAKVEYTLTAGNHVLHWLYAKDSSQSNFADAGWVDNITIFTNVANKTGNHFYTTSENPQNKSNNACLSNMPADSSCTVTWLLNATSVNQSHFFIATVNSSDTTLSSTNTSPVNISILEAPFVDVTAPTIVVVRPANNTKYNTLTIELNFTSSDETAVSECWYQLDTNTNVSIASCANTTFTPGRGAHNITIYSNDTSNNLANSGKINFSINSLPTISNLVLNTTDLTNNNTNQNLTSYWTISDVDPDLTRNITNWLVNGTPLAVLYFPFEGGSNATFTQDFSGYGNNGTVTEAFYNVTGSLGGLGAYKFDGVDDFINVSNSDSLNITEEITIMLWIKDPVTSGWGNNYTFQRVTSQFNTSYPATCTWTHQTGTDDGMHSTTLGFEFPFFGKNISASDPVYMDTNGRLSFSDTASDYDPTDSEMQNDRMIAAIWQDYGAGPQNHEQYCTNQGTAPNKFAVYLWNSTFYNNDGSAEAEIVLYQNGTVLFRSGDIGAHTDTWYRGLSNGTGSDYHYDTASTTAANDSKNAYIWYYPYAQAAALPGLQNRTILSKKDSYTLQMRNMTVYGFINGTAGANVSVEIDKNWTHIAMTFNGSEMRMYQNGVKVDSLSISAKINPNINNIIIGDLINGSMDDLYVFNRSLSAQQISAFYYNKTGLIVSQETTSGQNWTLEVTPNDGFESGTTVRSNQLITQGAAVVGNTLPTVPVLTFLTNTSTTTDRLTNLSWNLSTDVDDDIISYHLIIDDNIAFNNPEINISSIYNDTINNATYTLTTALTTDTTYYWKVRANDSEGYGPFSKTFQFTVNSLLSITLTDSQVNFGTVSPGSVHNTTDGVPTPFRIENNGNVNINLTVTGSSLLNSTAFPSNNYQFKIRANESSSFNTTLSNNNYTNVTASSSDDHVVDLNWINSKDDFLCDLNVTVPSDEPSGDKAATITFTVVANE